MCKDCNCKRGLRGYTGQAGADSPDANSLLYKAYIKDETELEGNPESSVFVDTINGVWSHPSVGTYRYTKTGAFTASPYNTFFTVTNGKDEAEVRVKLEIPSSNYITLKTYNSSGVLTDDLIEQMFLSIQIYS